MKPNEIWLDIPEPLWREAVPVGITFPVKLLVE
jgi:hypothetical protein